MDRRREFEREDELSGLLYRRFGERGGTLEEREEDGRESAVVLRAFEAGRSSFDLLATLTPDDRTRSFSSRFAFSRITASHPYPSHPSQAHASHVNAQARVLH